MKSKTAFKVFVWCVCAAACAAALRFVLPQDNLSKQGIIHFSTPAVLSGKEAEKKFDPALVPFALDAKLDFSAGKMKYRAVLLRTGEGDHSVRVMLEPDGTLKIGLGEYTPPEARGVIMLDGGACKPGLRHTVTVHADRTDAVHCELDGKTVADFIYHHLNYRVGDLRISAPQNGMIYSAQVSYAPAKVRWLPPLLRFIMLPLCIALLFAGLAALAYACGRIFIFHVTVIAGFAALLFCAATRTTFSLNPDPGYYADLAYSFAHGHTFMPRPVPDELLHADNPYSYAYAFKYRIWDYSMYKGKFFLYFGPAPALVRLCFADMISTHFALLLYGITWAAFFWLCVCRLRELYFADAPPWMVYVLGAAGALNPVLLYLLNIPDVYTEAVLASTAFGAGGIYFALLAYEGADMAALLSGLCFALGFASRVNTLFACVPFLALMLPRDGKKDCKKMLFMSAPVFAGGLALLAYNYARFENPFEFGVTYQYNATHWYVAHKMFFSVRYIPAHIYEYFMRLPYFYAHFPLMRGSGPSGLVSDSGVFSVFLWTPLTLFALLPLDARGRREKMFSLALLCSAALTMLVLFANKVVSVRYMADFCNTLALAGALGIFVLLRRRPKLAYFCTALCAAFSLYVGIAMLFTIFRIAYTADYAAIMRFMGIV